MQNYDKFISFLKGLETGLEIEISGLKYVCGVDDQGYPRIAHKMKVIGEDGEERYELMQGLDLPEINNFIIYIINQISDDDETEINANIGLNKIKKDGTSQ
jgi:hypothetical protein